MYRYSANSEITYTPEDLNLYRESPFASWMERLTLENPDHGIARDEIPTNQRGAQSLRRSFELLENPQSERLAWQDFVSGVSTPGDSETENQSAGMATFLLAHLNKHSDTRLDNASGTILDYQPGVESGARGKDVVSISKYIAESERRATTLAAMHRGAEYIAHAQLALGPLSCSTDILIRCEGASELGGYHYLPLATRSAPNPAGDGNVIHGLCFAADLLESLQGKLPAQLLLMNARESIECLPTADHVQRFRDLKYEFMQAQLSFRKHRMPNPAESAHYGRWSNCARSVLQQRAAISETSSAVSCGNTRHNSAGRAGHKGLADAMQSALDRSKTKNLKLNRKLTGISKYYGNVA